MTNPQQAHYEAMHDEYSAHYYDATSMAYRRKFVFEQLFRGLDLSGKSVAELACGSGYNSLELREMFPDIKVEGFDLSTQACDDYRRLVGAPAHHFDLTLPLTHTTSFDAAFIIGGLHHCVADLPNVFKNISSLVRPGGVFIAFEPNARFFLQSLRDYWYRKDKYFEAETERALEPAELTQLAAEYFTLERQFFTGGPAYFLIANSLVMRVPQAVKPVIAMPLFMVESAWNRIPSDAAFPAFGTVFRRNS